ncbi:MAG TPA: hypothetical protein VEB86_07630 [Chryseosolibacter sp.]|nr:hypothetical protein [Chryseosolibacter sp.]
MKTKFKFIAIIIVLVASIASCNKPADNPDTDGKDSIVNDTTTTNTVQTDSIPADTTKTPGQ